MLKDGRPIGLTKTEFHLLVRLAQSPNQVFSRDQLLDQVWDYRYTGDGRLVDTHIRRLRTKIETDPQNPKLRGDGARPGLQVRRRDGTSPRPAARVDVRVRPPGAGAVASH